jgi:quaternary ammonium compound-resistance protein SugE
MESAVAWTFLLIAAVLEIGWAVGLKYSQGLSRPLPSALTILAMLGSFWFLSQAVRTLPIGTAYAIWTGIGAVGTAVLGIVLLGEAATLPRLFSIGLIVAGIAGLKSFA